MLHSWGAIQSLEQLLGLLHQDGFILINDYGQTMVSRDDEFEHQRFSLATFVGVNFPMLRAYFAEHQKLQWLQPAGEGNGIHTRMLFVDALRSPLPRRFDFALATSSSAGGEGLGVRGWG